MENYTGRKFALIVNPAAGSARTKASRNKLISDLCRAYHSATGQELSVFETRYPGHATELARNAAAQDFAVCLAMGGDGTMNEVASGLMGTSAAMGLIPMGSGNGLARHLGYHMDPIKALFQCLEAETIRMDAGKWGSRFFFLTAGMGFEGKVAHLFASRKGRGFFQYLKSAAFSFFSYRPESFSFEMQGRKVQESPFTLSIANGSQYGNNAIIAPGASVCDGLFQMVCIRAFPVWAAPALFYRLMNGSIASSAYFECSQTDAVTFYFDHPSPGHIDGEPVIFEGRVDISIIPSALHVLVPGKAEKV
jgi:YegS/Rv2252/BmrU family lipid kinase